MKRVEYLLEQTQMTPEKMGEVLGQVYLAGYERGMMDEEVKTIEKLDEEEFIGRVIGHWYAYLAKERDQTE